MAEEGRPREGARRAAPAQDDLFSRWVAARTAAPPTDPGTGPAPTARPPAPSADPGQAAEVRDAGSAEAATAHGPDTRDAGRAVLAAFLDDQPAAAAAPPAPVPAAAPSPPVDDPGPPTAADPEPAPAASTTGTPSHASTDATFPVRRGAQRVVAVALLGSLAATAWTAYQALAPEPSEDTPTLGLAATCAALTLVLWAVRASMPATVVEIRRGLLEVHRGDDHWSIDLTSPHTPAELVGRPVGRRWRIRFPRLDQDPLVLDASMVDPDDFTAAVLRFRPDLEAVLCPWQSRAARRSTGSAPST